MKKENKSNCQQAQFFYFDYLTRQDNSASTPWFEHIEHCPQCQDEIKRLENEICNKTGVSDKQPHILALHHRYLSQWIECDAVKPFLASLAHPELFIRTETPITVHITQCPLCQKDLQAIASLHLSDRQLVEATQILSDEPRETGNLSEQVVVMIQNIRNRKPSGIITRLEVDTEGKTRVQVETPYKTGLKIRPIQFRPLARFAAAAAILLVVSLVFFRATIAGGVSLQDVYRAVNSIVNCRIEISSLDQNAPVQKILISRKLNLAVFQQADETIILDIKNKRTLISRQKTDILTGQSKQKILSEINQTGFGLLPFENITQISPGYQWKRQDNLSQNKAWEVYDLSWKESSKTGVTIEKTWRGYLLRNSHLPVRIQWFEKRPEQAEKIVIETTIQYPDTQTIIKELETNPLYRLFKGDQVE